jgi:ParB family transcriptional regulator, chromosome partitioning protein
METKMIVQQVLLNEIVASKTNPRKYFDEVSIIELAESIRQKGLLQPILIRPHGKQFEIVCGERRYRAAIMIQSTNQQRNTIDAIVRELSDQDVLEAQLIENFQREDIHPMEEAVAIKAAVDEGKYSYEDIAAKVGKKISYIRQRMKLNDLIASFQKLFYRNGLSISDAFKLCVLPVNYQKEIFKEEIGKDDGSSCYGIRQWVLDKYKGDLSDVCFSLTDDTLDKKMGACSGCQFNSCVSMLFPELAAMPRCTNIACFKRKSEIHFDREFKKVKEDASILLVYSCNNEPDSIVALKREGLQVLRLGYGDDCREIEEPVLTTFEEYMQQYEDDGYSEKKLREMFNQEVKGFEKKKIAFDKKVATAKYKKAFVVFDQYDRNDGRRRIVS